MKIIGGPALRRAEASRVFIWLVLDTRATSIDAQIKTAPGAQPVSVCVATSKKPVVLGDHLFVYLLDVKCSDQSFPINRKLYYDIVVDGKNLDELGLISGARSIVYRNEKLPSFVIPDKHKNILQASCRKPHAGAGHRPSHDQMAKADRLVGDTISSMAQRPSMLILTGDQIYADDVASPLLAFIRKSAVALTGWAEELPPKKKRNIVPSKVKLRGRETVLRDKALGFTSGKKKNHLMSFGEYMAMYLVVWGGLKARLPEYDEIEDDIVMEKVRTGPRRGRVLDRAGSRRDYQKELARVQGFLKSAWKMRRLMANVNTYMIFDDHEVTDDWNLTEEIATSFKTVPLSRRIISNALAAYWACQGWGNNPKAFDRTFKDTLQAHLTTKKLTAARNYETALANVDWSFHLDTYPIVFVLNTRTRRVFDNGKMAQLVEQEQLDKIKRSLVRLERKYRSDSDSQSVLLVSPAPVYGFTAVELVQLKFNDIVAAEKIDAESWVGNAEAFANLYKVLANVFTRDCLILSGDVHYAFNRIESMRLSQWNKPVNIIQLTSSASCNQPLGVAKLSLNVLASASKMKCFNKLHSRYIYPGNSRQFLSGDCNIGHIRLEDGRATHYSLYFYDDAARRQYKWEYDLTSPEYVAF